MCHRGLIFVGWSRRLQAIAQNGLTFARDSYDIERYTLPSVRLSRRCWPKVPVLISR